MRKLRNWCGVIFLSLLPVLALGQSLEQTIAFGDARMAAADYKEAANAYERVLFFLPSDSIRSNILSKKGQALLGVGDYEQAFNTFMQAKERTKNDSLKAEYSLLATRALLLFGARQNALLYLNDQVQPVTAEQVRAKTFYTGLALLRVGNVDSAEATFLQLTDADQHVKEAFREFRRSRRNPALAQVLSIVPGLGQAYSGDWRNAANSFFLVGGLAGAGVLVFQVYSLEVALITAGPMLLRYYTLGTREAKRIAIERNQQAMKALYLDIERIINTQ